MRPTILIVFVLASLACSTLTERLVNDAMKGLVFEADYIPIEGGDPLALAAFHEHLTQGLRIDIGYLPSDAEELHGAYGISYHAGDQLFIRLRQDLSINGSIEVLAHEAAHLFQPPYLSRPQGDVFAEIVSAHVSSRMGVPDAAGTSALWLRQHKPSLRMALDLELEIQYVAKILTPGSGARVAWGR